MRTVKELFSVHFVCNICGFVCLSELLSLPGLLYFRLLNFLFQKLFYTSACVFFPFIILNILFFNFHYSVSCNSFGNEE